MVRKQIERILSEQQHKVTIISGKIYFPVDISLTNGNILLRSFRVMELEGSEIKGLTWQEEYSAPRENREPVYTYFDIDEIAALHCRELDIDYQKVLTNGK